MVKNACRIRSRLSFEKEIKRMSVNPLGCHTVNKSLSYSQRTSAKQIETNAQLIHIIVYEHETKDVQGQGPSTINLSLFASLMFTRLLNHLPLLTMTKPNTTAVLPCASVSKRVLAQTFHMKTSLKTFSDTVKTQLGNGRLEFKQV